MLDVPAKTTLKLGNKMKVVDMDKGQADLLQDSNTLAQPEKAQVVTLAPTHKISGVSKGVPLPPAQGGGGKAKYPWETMEAGDAFFVEGAKVETFYTLTTSASKKFGRKFAARKLADGGIFGPEYEGKPGVGVWRTE